MQIVGREMSVDEVLAEVERDRVFYEQSGGGVTLSGGDPLAQAGFAEAVLSACQSRGLHTAIDTAGLASNGALGRLARHADIVLFDLKVIDEAKHKAFTGVSNAPIIENLKSLVAAGREVWVRIPLVHGVNDDDGNVRQTIDLVRSLGSVRRIGLLPYHAGGLDKARRIGQESRFRLFESPSEERLAAIEAAFRDAGFDVRRGG
jgi:pyruvate formate lyase activating enzyme